MSGDPATTYRPRTRRCWPVAVLSSMLVLSACTATTTIEAATSPQPTAVSVVEAPLVSPEPTASNGSDDSPEPAPINTPVTPGATDGGDGGGGVEALFELQGELPLSTADVNELIEFIEDDAGRPFLRPPVIVAQTREAFFDGLADDLDDFNAGSEDTIRTLQALGLTDLGVAEVSQAFQDLLLSPEGILGYYDPVPDELYVPIDSEGDDDFRSLLVHELTHALDGQHADLNMLEVLIEEGDVSGDYEPVIALQAIAEGRASSVQNRWMAVNRVVQTIPDDLGALANVPPALVLSISIPYAFGEQFIEANGGAAGTWGWLTDPPASSEEFMVAGTPHDEPIIDVPAPVADGPIIDEAVYGASDIFVWLLGESLDPDPTLIFPTFEAVDGWAGGRSVMWGDDTESCIRIAFAADTADDLAELELAIGLWADGDAQRSVVIDGDLLVVTGCAPFVP